MDLPLVDADCTDSNCHESGSDSERIAFTLAFNLHPRTKGLCPYCHPYVLYFPIIAHLLLTTFVSSRFSAQALLAVLTSFDLLLKDRIRCLCRAGKAESLTVARRCCPSGLVCVGIRRGGVHGLLKVCCLAVNCQPAGKQSSTTADTVHPPDETSLPF